MLQGGDLESPEIHGELATDRGEVANSSPGEVDQPYPTENNTRNTTGHPQDSWGSSSIKP